MFFNNIFRLLSFCLFEEAFKSLKLQQHGDCNGNWSTIPQLISLDRPKMADSSSGLPPFNDDDNTHKGVPNIPVEIVSDEEMALIEAALAAAVTTARSSSSAIHPPSCSSQNLFNTRSIHSITLLSKRGLPSSQLDIEDLCKSSSTQKKIKVNESLLQRFRRNKGLAVTDITRTV